jgi:hypothetical protein
MRLIPMRVRLSPINSTEPRMRLNLLRAAVKFQSSGSFFTGVERNKDFASKKQKEEQLFCLVAWAINRVLVRHVQWIKGWILPSACAGGVDCLKRLPLSRSIVALVLLWLLARWHWPRCP